VGFLAGAAAATLFLRLWQRGAVGRDRLEAAERVSAAEAAAQAERDARERLEGDVRALQAERVELDRARTLAEERVRQAEETVREQRRFLEESRQQLEHSFKSLATNVLEGSSRQFLELAETRWATARAESQGELEQRKQAIEALLTPLRETLGRLDSRTGDLEKARVDAYAKIDQHIRALAEQTLRLEEKTTTLSTALRGSQVRGRWGEIALRNVVELAGMTEHCDFEEQPTLADGKRPDMVVRLPGDRRIAVDAKTPLSSYLAALEAKTDSERNKCLDGHVQSLRGHIQALASREYAETVDGDIDLVVLFLPGDPYLSAAFSRAPDLQVDALRSKVLLATPSTLIALLRTVAIYWQQEAMAKNAELIAGVARELYGRAVTFSEHLQDVGKGLRGAVDAYNQAVGSFERRLVPMARQLEDLKATEGARRPLPLLEPLEETPRDVPTRTP